MKRTSILVLAMSLACAISFDAAARNTPCSGRKGGVSHCENGKFVCNDGTISRSKKVCQNDGAAYSERPRRKGGLVIYGVDKNGNVVPQK